MREWLAENPPVVFFTVVIASLIFAIIVGRDLEKHYPRKVDKESSDYGGDFIRRYLLIPKIGGLK